MAPIDKYVDKVVNALFLVLIYNTITPSSVIKSCLDAAFELCNDAISRDPNWQLDPQFINSEFQIGCEGLPGHYDITSEELSCVKTRQSYYFITGVANIGVRGKVFAAKIKYLVSNCCFYKVNTCEKRK